MEAPENIYLSAVDLEEVGYLLSKSNDMDDIEYVRAEVFIEKAGVKLKELMFNLIFQGPLYRLYREEVIDNFVETFKNYMKGE